MKTTLVTVESTDHLMLPALWYEPSGNKRGAAIWLHGNGGASSFYSVTRTNALAQALTSAGIGFLALNNRGAETIKMLKKQVGHKSKRVLAGFAHERIRDCVPDIDGALSFLHRAGYANVALLGHSTGANKIALYDRMKRGNRLAAYVLLGPGDDVGIYHHQLGVKGFAAALAKAKAEIARGRGHHLVPERISPLPLSWAALYDTINPHGDYNIFPFLECLQELSLSKPARRFREIRALQHPTLAVFGELDEYCFDNVPGCADLLSAHAPQKVPFTLQIIPQADHSFGGHESEMAELVADWLGEQLTRRQTR